MFAVVGAFAEALRATFQPCTFLLIVPTLTAVVAGRARWQALAAAVLAGVVGGWILVDNRWILDGWLLRAAAAAVIGGLALLVAPGLRSRLPGAGTRLDGAWAQASVVGAVTLVASMWWRPCVGEELGTILNGAQHGIGEQLVPMAAYMLGALTPVAMVVAIRYALDPPDRWLRPVTWVAASVGIERCPEPGTNRSPTASSFDM